MKQEEYDIPFTDEWYDTHYEKFGMMSKGVEIALLVAGYKLISAVGIMLLVVGAIYKFVFGF